MAPMLAMSLTKKRQCIPFPNKYTANKEESNKSSNTSSNNSNNTSSNLVVLNY